MRTTTSRHFSLPDDSILIAAGSEQPHHVELPTLGDQQVIGVEHLLDLSLTAEQRQGLTLLGTEWRLSSS